MQDPFPLERPVLAGWVVAAVAALALFVGLVSRVDPDRAAPGALGERAAAAQARALLAERGLLPDTSVAPVVQRRRGVVYLDSLQARHGRDEALRRLGAGRGGNGGRPFAPAYFWEVAWRPRPGAGSEGRPAVRTVRLSPDGRLLGLDVPIVQPEALRPDSLALLARPLAPDEGRALAAPNAEARAAAVARHHLGRSALARRAFEVDSVRDAGRPGLDAARVFLSSRSADEPPLYVQAEVATTGALLGLRHQVAPPGAVPPDGFSKPRTVLNALVGAFFVVVLLLTLVRFGRRLNARLVDTRGAVRDGLFASALCGLWWFSSSAPSILENFPSLLGGAVVVALNTLLVMLCGGLLTLAASGLAESVTRPVWPEKMFTLALLRRGLFHDARLGRAFVRGIAAGALVLAFAVFVLRVTPGLPFYTDAADAVFGNDVVYTPIGSAFGWSLWGGLLLVLAVVVPVVTATWHRRGWRAVGVVGAALAAGLLAKMFNEGSVAGELAFGLAIGLVLVGLFVRYDALTAAVAFAAASLLWQTREAWVLPGSAVFTDGVVALVVVGVALAVGAGAAWIGHVTGGAEAFVPVYLREREREARMSRELEIAHTVQQRFLPATMPRLPGAELAALCLPAYEVGGDLYDFVEVGPGRLAVLVGDVSGKGIQAAFVMTLVKGAVQTLAREGHGPAEVLRRLNRLFRATVPRGLFITMVYGVLDTGAGTFTLARAGHNPVLLRRAAGGAPAIVQPDGMGIGLADGALFDARVEETTLRLAPGDALVLYTDGFSEAMDATRALFGDDRLSDAVEYAEGTSADELLSAAVSTVQAFVGAAEQHDDMTMVIVRMTTPAA